MQKLGQSNGTRSKIAQLLTFGNEKTIPSKNEQSEAKKYKTAEEIKEALKTRTRQLPQQLNKTYTHNTVQELGL